MLDRSRPAPFSLQLPLAASEDKERLYSALQNDLGRLRSYAGPRDVYLYLTKQDLPMPYLTEIVFLKETDHDQWLRFDFPPTMGSHGAPQLRRLVAPMISIPATCAALHSLKELKFSVYGPSSAYRRLFLCCPNLTMLELVTVRADTVLPVPLPPNLCDVSLRAPDGACVEFGLPLAAWSGRLIRRLSLYGEKSLAAALDAFASSFPGPLDIVMTRNQATISLNSASAHDAQTQHVIYPFSWRQDNQLLALRGPCGGRLVSITVPGERFCDFFKAQLILPRLTRLEFHLDGHFDACGSIPDLPSPEFHLSAPSLSDMLLRVPFDAQAFYSDADRWCEAAVAALCQHLRALIAYDAALLETMAIRGSPGVIDFLNCYGLSQYAKCSV